MLYLAIHAFVYELQVEIYLILTRLSSTKQISVQHKVLIDETSMVAKSITCLVMCVCVCVCMFKLSYDSSKFIYA